MNKRDTLEKAMTSEQKDGIQELQEAFMKYSKNSNDKTYGEVLLEFFLAAKNTKVAFCPVASVNTKEKGFIPGKMETTNGKMYVLCTSPEEAALCPEEIIVLIGMDRVVEIAADDQDNNGICLNPHGGHPCFFPREYILKILGTQ
jgi:hypothetical protein